MAPASSPDAADDGDAADEKDNDDGWAAPASCKNLHETRQVCNSGQRLVLQSTNINDCGEAGGDGDGEELRRVSACTSALGHEEIVGGENSSRWRDGREAAVDGAAG